MSLLRRKLAEIWIVVRSVWLNVALYASMLVGVAALMGACKCYPDMTFGERLVQAFYMSELQGAESSDHHILPTVLVFLLPALTVIILGEGVLRMASIYLGRRQHRAEWEELMVKQLSGHTVICGMGELGRALLERLLEQNPDAAIVVVDTHADVLSELGMSGPNLHSICGDMTRRETLESANVGRASKVAFVSGSDSSNLEGAVKALALNEEAHVWVRLYRAGISDLLDKESRPNLHFFTPYDSAAQRLAGHLVGSMEGAAEEQSSP